MVVALSLAVALFYGAADFCGGLAARRTPAAAVVVWSQAAGLAVLLPALLVIPGVARPGDLELGLVCGLSGTLAVGLLYRGLAIGAMGIVSPITAALAACLPVGWGLAHGERPAVLALVGIACALAAVVLISATPARRPVASGGEPVASGDAPAGIRRRLPAGVPAALGAGVGFGVFFIALAQAHADAGLYPLLVTRLLSVGLLLAGGSVLRLPLRVPRRRLPTILLCGVLDMAANLLYVLAAHAGALSIVAVISSLYPAATVGLAALVLRERLVRPQWAGVGLALAGVLCMGLAR